VQTRDATGEDFKEIQADGLKSRPGVSESCSNVSNDYSVSDSDSLVTVSVTIQKGSVLEDKSSVLDNWSSGNDEVESHLGFDGDGGIEMRTLSMKGYQYLKNEEADDFDTDIDDDEFLCETCGKPATNGMRVCDSCFC